MPTLSRLKWVPAPSSADVEAPAETEQASLRREAGHPEMLERMKGLWHYYAGIYKGLPLDDRTALEIGLSERPRPS